MEPKSSQKHPKSSIAKKVSIEYNHQIPFLDRRLSYIKSILLYMQLKREEELDKETGMYYTPKAAHPYDSLSYKQFEVFGGLFSIESNADALHKIIPIHISKPYVAPKINYQFVEEPHPQLYSSPIGPLTFLGTTVPQAPDPSFVDFLNKI